MLFAFYSYCYIEKQTTKQNNKQNTTCAYFCTRKQSNPLLRPPVQKFEPSLLPFGKLSLHLQNRL